MRRRQSSQLHRPLRTGSPSTSTEHSPQAPEPRQTGVAAAQSTVAAQPRQARVPASQVGLVPPQSVEVRLAGGASPGIISLDPKHKVIERYRVRELALVEGYASAVALDSGDAEIEIVQSK